MDALGRDIDEAEEDAAGLIRQMRFPHAVDSPHKALVDGNRPAHDLKDRHRLRFGRVGGYAAVGAKRPNRDITRFGVSRTGETHRGETAEDRSPRLRNAISDGPA